MEKTILIEGMMCNHCKMAVEKVLGAVEGVASVTVDLEKKTAALVCTADVADAVLFAAIEKKDFTPVKVL